MCNPIVMAAMYGIQTITSISSQNKQAKMEVQAAEDAAQADYNILVEQQRQVNQKASLEKAERQRQALRERGRLRVALGEAGIDGVSPGREMANAFLQEAYDKAIIEENRENQGSQNLQERFSVGTNAKSRINAANSKRIGGLNGALMIGSSAVSGYGAGYQFGKTLKGE